MRKLFTDVKLSAEFRYYVRSAENIGSKIIINYETFMPRSRQMTRINCRQKKRRRPIHFRRDIFALTLPENRPDGLHVERCYENIECRA